MKNGLRPYTALKDSGVKWLGRVPTHWRVIPLKRVGWFCSGAGFPISAQGNAGGDILFAKVSDMNRMGNGREIATAANSVTRKIADRLRAFVFPPGTIVFPKVGGALLTNKRRILVRETCIDNNLMGYVVKGAETEFVFQLLQWIDLGRMAKPGPVPAISEGEVREVRVPLPSRSEQRAIVLFLDHADRRIQRYIRAKEKLIELLEEQKQAIIHQAVTGQIDVRTGQPYPAYKDSRVEWLGEVPEHWEVPQLGRVARDRCDGPFGSGLKSSHYTDAGVRVVRLQNIGHGVFLDEDRAFVSREHSASLGDHSVMAGDVLIAGLGDDRRPAGRACVAPAELGPAMVKADCFRFRLDETRVHPPFVALQLASTARVAAAVLSTGATRQRTNLQTTSRRAIAIPWVREQVRILEYVTSRTICLGQVLNAVKRENELLSEYRTRLIADVVTGKLDVRQAAVSLPETDALPTEVPSDNPEIPVATQADTPSPPHPHP